MDTKKIAIRGVICALAGGILWGFSGTCTQFLMMDYQMPAAFVSWVRMTVAGALLMAYLLVRKRPKLIAMFRDRSTVVQLIVYAIGGVALGQYAYTSCTRYTDAGTATMLQCVGIVILIAFTCVSKHKAPKRIEVIATAMALLATFLIATQGDPTSLSLPLAGLVWGLLNAVSNAFFAGYPGKLLNRWGSLAVVGAGMLIGSMLILPMAHPWDVELQLDLMSVAGLASVSVLGTFVSFTLFLQGVKDIGGVKASLIGVIEPVSATFFSWALLGTHFTSIDMVGFAVMIAMVVMVSVKPEKRDVEDEPVTTMPSRRPTVRVAVRTRSINGVPSAE